jgi:hypothetical protein
MEKGWCSDQCGKGWWSDQWEKGSGLTNGEGVVF